MKQTTTSIKLTAKQIHAIARWLEENSVTECNPVTITQSETGIGPGIDVKAEPGFRKVVQVKEGKLDDLSRPDGILIFAAQAKRLGVKWILGGECGHMWRVLHQYMSTLNGPADFLKEPVSPITGTKFTNANVTKMVHIAEFTADLIKHKHIHTVACQTVNLVTA